MCYQNISDTQTQEKTAVPIRILDKCQLYILAQVLCFCAVILGFVLFFSEASASILIFPALGTQTSALGTFIPGFPSVDWLVTCFADAAVLALGLAPHAQGCSRNTRAFVIRGVPHTHHLQLEKKVSVFRLQDFFSFVETTIHEFPLNRKGKADRGGFLHHGGFGGF